MGREVVSSHFSQRGLRIHHFIYNNDNVACPNEHGRTTDLRPATGRAVFSIVFLVIASISLPGRAAPCRTPCGRQFSESPDVVFLVLTLSLSAAVAFATARADAGTQSNTGECREGNVDSKQPPLAFVRAQTNTDNRRCRCWRATALCAVSVLVSVLRAHTPTQVFEPETVLTPMLDSWLPHVLRARCVGIKSAAIDSTRPNQEKSVPHGYRRAPAFLRPALRRPPSSGLCLVPSALCLVKVRVQVRGYLVDTFEVLPAHKLPTAVRITVVLLLVLCILIQSMPMFLLFLMFGCMLLGRPRSNDFAQVGEMVRSLIQSFCCVCCAW